MQPNFFQVRPAPYIGSVAGNYRACAVLDQEIGGLPRGVLDRLVLFAAYLARNAARLGVVLAGSSKSCGFSHAPHIRGVALVTGLAQS